MGVPVPDPAALRVSYADAPLTESLLATDPMEQFGGWFDQAVEARLAEPNAMVLATVSARHRPRGRIVLLKGYGPEGFKFFTNYHSRKGQDIAANPAVSLDFPWHEMYRQVIVEGEAARLSRAESAAYFHSRPHGSQLGAWASEAQSAVEDRAAIDGRFAELERRWPAGTEVPLPDFWGGYLIVPTVVEFWQGRPNRLHDRLRYRRQDGGWVIERLSP
jgi:pyridoxamine 5'-phosphate oxidase